ncbi:hypothetical protein [Limnoglobus roseus]|uniref:hypothetical protein n=1 Tax=Limnoglobus roseus TaxID=2598579 RepID=UPI0011EAE837|nr:hypothetical protein [Limnoglobus roseus]
MSGTVNTADGKPLKSGNIYFEPETPGQGREANATVANGAFKTKLFLAKYRVALDMEDRKTTLPAKFTKFATSGQHAEIKDGTTPLVFDLK